MGHYAFLIAAGFIVAGSMLSMGLKDTNDAQQETVRVLYKEEARDAALTGMNLTLRRIIVDEGIWSGAGTYAIDTTEYKRSRFYTTVVPVGVDTVDIMSRGIKDYINRRGNYVDTTHTVDVRIVRTDLSGGTPEAFLNSIVSEHEMVIGGAFNVTSLDESVNANVHSNDVIETNGNNFHVDGFGTSTALEPDTRQGDNFEPNVNPDGLESTYQDDYIRIPALDLEMLKLAAENTGFYTADAVAMDLSTIEYASFGDWADALHPELAGTGIGREPDKPFIFYTDQDIHFFGEKTFAGWGAFVSVAALHTNSGVQLHGGIDWESGLPVNQMGLFTAGDMMINGTADITATMYAGGLTQFNGTASVTGGVVTESIGAFTGTFDLIWSGFNEGFGVFFGVEEFWGPRIAAWAEW